jgi:DnaJ-class molecular chaperone
MTNKTVTLSRELVEHAMLSCFEAGHGITHDKLRAALAEPVPPSVCATCNGTGIEYDGAGHTCTACNGVSARQSDKEGA